MGLDRVYSGVRNGETADSVSFGLITVVPSEVTSLNEPMRTIVISGTDGAACHTAAEFFCSAKKMKGMRERFRKDGLSTFPPAYQIVVKCRIVKAASVSSEYEAHVVLREH